MRILRQVPELEKSVFSIYFRFMDVYSRYTSEIIITINL